MSSSQEGGRKISGEEKNLANKQAELFGLQTDQMKALQAVLQNLQSSQYQILGFDPTTGMPLQRGQLPTAPTAVSGPQGARPQTQRELFDAGLAGKNWGKNDNAAQTRSLQAQQAWDAQNQQYQQYLQQQQAYDQQVAQIQANPESFYLPDVAGQRAQESSLLDQILSGQLSPDAAAGQGAVGSVAAGRAGLMSEFLRWINNNPNAQAAEGALSGYQNELNTGGAEAPYLQQLLGLYGNELAGGAEAPALQQLMGAYQNQLAGNIPESAQMNELLAGILRGAQGTEPVNPLVARQFDIAEQDQRSRLFQQLGSGYETSSAGIEALNSFRANRVGTYDLLNQTDLMNAVQGYGSLLGGAQNRQAQTANQYLGLSANQQARQANIANQYGGLSANQQARQAQFLNQYLGLNEDTRLNTNAALQGYTGLTNFSESQRMQEYINELTRRTGLAGLQSSVATAPYTGVDYTNLINSYTGALGAATQRQTGPVQQGSGLGGAIGGLVGTGLGGAAGYAIGGAPGAFMGAQLGGSLGGSAGGGTGYQPPPLYNMGGGYGGGGGASTSNSFNLGSFYTTPYYG